MSDTLEKMIIDAAVKKWTYLSAHFVRDDIAIDIDAGVEIVESGAWVRGWMFVSDDDINRTEGTK